MSREKRVPTGELLPFAERAAYALSERYDRLAVCGSLRRLAPTAGDVDIVVAGDLRRGIFDVRASLSETFDTVVPEFGNGDDRPRVAHTVSLDGVEHKVDVWVVPDHQFGSGILHATGSGLFNVILRRWARHLGLWLDVRGVHRDGITIASETEEDCFSALGLPFYRPQDRVPENMDDLLGVLNAEGVA